MQLLENRWLRGGIAAALALAGVAALGARPIAHAWERYERAQWHKKVLDTYNQMRLLGSDEIPALGRHEVEHADGVEEDDATIRRLYSLAYYGNQALPDVSEQRFLAAQRESARWAHMLPGAQAKSPGGA